MSDVVLLGPNGVALPAGIGKAVQMMANAQVEVGYRHNSARAQALDGWRPAMISADVGALWDRNETVARVHDLLATEPLAQGAVDRRLDMLVGASWRPILKPDAERLGITPEQADLLGRDLMRIWREWSEDPLCRNDVEETLSGALQLHMLAMEKTVTGDGLGVLRWKPRGDWPFRTALQVVDADRLSNPNGQVDSLTLRGGVHRDSDGKPLAYSFQNVHPGDVFLSGGVTSYEWTTIARRQPWGRPQVLHMYDKARPGQSRGISRLVAGLARFKQLQRFSEGELANAVINALFAATITSTFDPALAQQQLTSPAIADIHSLRNGFYDTARPTLAGSGIQHLFPGDELKFNASPRQTAAIEAFTTVFQRALASGLGLSYEIFSMDWSKVNYSSARAGLIEVWRGIMKERSQLGTQVATPLLMAVVEDAIDADLVQVPAGMPDLYEAPAAWLRGRWLGPPKGWYDPVKEPLGAVAKIEAGLSTFEDEAAEQGLDFEVIPASLGAAAAKFHAHGLTPPSLAAMIALNNVGPDAEVQVRETLPQP